MELVPGIEFSTVEEGKDVHVVGLFIDHHNEVFRLNITQTGIIASVFLWIHPKHTLPSGLSV